jgi:hypothetical protein
MREEKQSAVLRERDQLLSCWSSAFRRNSDWFSNEVTQLRNILRLLKEAPTRKRNEDLSDNIRKFHDKLGFTAKSTVERGGLCAGAIYRSSNFIEISSRSGARGRQNIHIEHTLPVRLLRNQLINISNWTYPRLLVWLLENSVATAITIEESRLIDKTLRDHSEAFNRESDSYLKPFVRYESLYGSGTIIWNVFDGIEVDKQCFQFKDHRDVLIRILREIGATDMLYQFGV